MLIFEYPASSDPVQSVNGELDLSTMIKRGKNRPFWNKSLRHYLG